MCVHYDGLYEFVGLYGFDFAQIRLRLVFYIQLWEADPYDLCFLYTIWSGVWECKRQGVRFSSGWGKSLILLENLGPRVGSKVAFPVSHWNHWIFYSEPQVRVRPTLWVSKCLWCPVPSVCSGLYYYTILRGSKSQPLITKKRWKKSEFFGWLIG